MPDNSQVNNIVLKFHYYKPREQYKDGDDNIRKRDFVSCNGSYNYVSYVHSGASEQLPKDYEEYIGNKEKSCGAFNQKGLLNDEELKELRKQLQTTQSCIWDMVISFKAGFGEKYCRDYEQAFEFVKSELPKFFTRAGLDKDNIVWYAGLHENTEHFHIHISFFEKEPLYYANGNTLKYHSGKVDKEVLISSKFQFEKKLTNATAEIIRARKDLMEYYNIDMSKRQITMKGKKLLLELYEQLPKDGRISYDSDNMFLLRKKVDDTTEFFLKQNMQTKQTYYDFLFALADFQSWKLEREYKEADNYKQDLLRRLGNLTIQTAIRIGKINNEIEMLNINMPNYKAVKKNYRKSILDQIIDLMEEDSKIVQEKIYAFESYMKKLEYYRKQIEYEERRGKYKESEYEM